MDELPEAGTKPFYHDSPGVYVTDIEFNVDFVLLYDYVLFPLLPFPTFFTASRQNMVIAPLKRPNGGISQQASHVIQFVCLLSLLTTSPTCLSSSARSPELSMM